MPTVASTKRRLATIYFNARNPLGFTGNKSKLLDAAVAPATSSRMRARLRNVAESWLESQPTFTLHKTARQRGFKLRKYRTTFPDRQWQADLVDMQALSGQNSGQNYILTAIDVFSRYAKAVPLKDKSFTNVERGFVQLFEGGRKPHLLQTDQGREFENHNIQSFFNKHGIHQFSVKSAYKAALVERFHRTLRARMYRVFTQTKSKRWVDILPNLLHSYNHSKHGALHTTPHEIYTNPEAASKAWDEQEGIIVKKKVDKDKLQIGDSVRLSLVRTTFHRGYTPNWTSEIFKVHQLDDAAAPTMYRVKDMSGEVIEGKFYRQELQKVRDQNYAGSSLQHK